MGGAVRWVARKLKKKKRGIQAAYSISAPHFKFTDFTNKKIDNSSEILHLRLICTLFIYDDNDALDYPAISRQLFHVRKGWHAPASGLLLGTCQLAFASGKPPRS